jgi:hypothetical protein
MSGIKISNYNFVQETARLLGLVNALTYQELQLKGLKSRIEQLIASASPGLKNSFPDELGQAQKWLSKNKLESPTLSIGLGEQRLKDEHQGRQAEVKRGEQAATSLYTVFNQKAGALGAKFTREMADLEARYYSRQELLRNWNTSQSIDAISVQLENLRRKLAEEDYREVEKVSARIKQDLEKRISESETLDSKHKNRLYLLRALRQVCQEMGFQELKAPVIENEGQPNSRIIYRVNTFDKGNITFFLTLDGIRSSSEIQQNLCFEEFDKLSDHLKEQFGIQTSFQPEHGERPPQLRRKGEKDEPQGTGKEMTA